jgi:SpoVK/Ycf46/Vps4 family AAA+-type ATPase
MDQGDIEARLLREPFNAELREQYAAALSAAGRSEDALLQYGLLRQQFPDRPVAYVAAARLLLTLGRDREAAERYREARTRPGFSTDAELESLLASQARVSTRPFAVIAGGLEDRVVDISQARPERIAFSDIAGLEALKKTIRMQIVEPFLHPSLFLKFRKKAGGGVLLYGPPGCGKTMMARAVATECRAEFLSVDISDVLSMWIGESSRNLASFFEKARGAQPCVLFFDEIDALAFSRSKAQSEHTRQVVNEFLSQLDGFGSANSGVLILAATNMPWDVDPAMKRPGRFSRQVFVPPPDEAARAHIIGLKLKDVPHEGIDAAAIARLTQHFSGADIDGLIEMAKEYALADIVGGQHDRVIKQPDLARAVAETRASTMDWLRTAQNLVKYAGADDTYAEVAAYLKAHKIR